MGIPNPESRIPNTDSGRPFDDRSFKRMSSLWGESKDAVGTAEPQGVRSMRRPERPRFTPDSARWKSDDQPAEGPLFQVPTF